MTPLEANVQVEKLNGAVRWPQFMWIAGAMSAWLSIVTYQMYDLKIWEAETSGNRFKQEDFSKHLQIDHVVVQRELQQQLAIMQSKLTLKLDDMREIIYAMDKRLPSKFPPDEWKREKINKNASNLEKLKEQIR